jgi:tight adherence protein D
MSNRKINRYIFIIALGYLLSGCEGSVTRGGKTYRVTENNEKVLTQAQNYSALIKLKRDELQKKEDPNVRLQLANYYYLMKDYNASLYYLKKLLETQPGVEVYLLQSKNLAAQEKYQSALRFIDMALVKQRNHGEALNLKGVIQAERGNFKAALENFEQARNAFYQEERVVNNIAVIHILEKRYHKAVQLLLPVYLRGYHEDRLMHNLTFALVKTGDLNYAKQIVKQSGYKKNPDLLVSKLFRVQSQ